ncbi:hypothetical protein WJX73_004205 [Symbiochloris irregularis]|uniref:Uncharacterized protein n=1 Tax=Symbiochloris irregularis TaxID=706552 RepID=A0AAW1PKP3_9CHLO
MKLSQACGLLAVLLLWLSHTASGEFVTLNLQKCSCGTGNAHASDTGSDNNVTFALPAPGEYFCLSLEKLGRQNETFEAISNTLALPSGTQLTIYNATNCTQQVETWSLYKSTSPYAVIPGSVNPGTLFSNTDTFLSLQIHVPLPADPIEDGYYQVLTGGEFSDLGNEYSNLYTDCGNFLSASASNDSLSFVNSDGITGLQQFLFQQVKAPNHYTISVPRGRGYSPAMLASPACDASEAVTLVPLANATAETTWVLSSVQQQSANHGIGFLANITSLARLQGACAENNATSLGVQPILQGPGGPDYNSCGIEDNAFLIPGAEVQFTSDYPIIMGGWGLLPVSPAYCQYGIQGSCAGPNDPSRLM